MSPHRSAGWESMFWLVFEKSSNAVALLDADQRFVDVNEATLGVLGQSRGDVVGRVATDLMRADERVEAAKRWRVLVEHGEDSGRQTFVHADGTEVVLHFAGRMAQIGGRRLAVFLVDSVVLRTVTPAGPPVAELTPRERQVIRLIALGATTNEMVGELSISAETVRTHVRNAMQRLNVHTRAQLVAMALALDAEASRQ